MRDRITFVLLASVIVVIGCIAFRSEIEQTELQAAERAAAITAEREARISQMGWPLFMDVLTAIESGGNVTAVGDGGQSVGPMQIQMGVVQDCNRLVGEQRYTAEDRTSLARSREMCRIYLDHYAVERRIGREPTWEDRARIWNGGPNGWKKECTEVYWAKFQLMRDHPRYN